MAEKEESRGIAVKKEEDFAEWYPQVCLKAGLADYSPVKGCMIIKPLGYAVWENIQQYFDRKLKEHGVKNAYFPLFIPESFFKREAEHAQGFSPEVAWIANRDEDGAERLAVRPTSETIMYDSYSRWIRSYRDLPLLINQWCNVVRWETRAVKLFLRSREFLWQEGHCVYETEKECHEETLYYLSLYKQMCEELLAVPVIAGRKSESEKFAGAKATYSIEAFMPDGKALQMGTSHDLGQNFAKAFGISFLGKDEASHLPWQNSWGVSTRMIGAVVMAHSDNQGLVLPPRLAPVKAVIVPIIFEKSKHEVLKKCREVYDELAKEYGKSAIVLDGREEYSSGWKYNEWEMKGVPLRVEIGPKDIEKQHVVMVRRDTKEKRMVKDNDIMKTVPHILEEMQHDLFAKARKFMEQSTVRVNTFEEFKKAAEEKKLILAAWCGTKACEEEIKSKTGGVTTRNIPLDDKKPTGNCIHCERKAEHHIYFSKSY